MRRAALLLALCAGCATEVVELLPELGAAADRNLGIDARLDSSLDHSSPDQAVDRASPDTQPGCVCRARCRVPSDCLVISATSTCQGLICTGAGNLCTDDASCGAAGVWFCAATPDSVLACP